MLRIGVLVEETAAGGRLCSPRKRGEAKQESLMQPRAHRLLGGLRVALDLGGRAQPVARHVGKDVMMSGVVDRRRPAEALQRKQPAILRSFHDEAPRAS